MRTDKGVEYSKAKLSRAGNFKARTGCVTCKRRRIKCDEAKPQCLNCIKHRSSCEGYTLAPTLRKTTSDGQLCLDLRRPPRTVHPTTETSSYTLSPALGNSHANEYFNEFIRLTQGPWISMQCSDGLWKTTLPQLAHSNSTLRYVATGIGALCLWHSRSGHGTLGAMSAPVSPGAEEDIHYFHAVAFYCEALRLQSQRNSVADAICLSVLLLTFEALRGNRQAALDHVNHGLALTVASLTEKRFYSHVARQTQHPAMLLREVANVLAPLGIQARSILRGRIGESVSLPNFSRSLKTCHQTMDSFMALANDIPPSSIGALHIPESFHSLHEAEELYVAVRQRQTALESVLQETVQASGLLDATSDHDVEQSWLNISKNSHVQSFCEETKDMMQALDSAFIPLFHTIIMSDPTSPVYLRAIQLRLHYFGIYVFDNTPGYLDLETLHSQTPLFREYLSLADLYLRATKRYCINPAQQLSFRCDLAWRLFTVAFFCRDPVVREDALWKLGDYPGCDGLWNTHALRALALRNKHVERQNAIEGSHMEQWQRLWRREFVFEDGGDRITFRYLEKDDASGRWQMAEEIAQLAGNLAEVRWERQAIGSSRVSLMADMVPR